MPDIIDTTDTTDKENIMHKCHKVNIGGIPVNECEVDELTEAVKSAEATFADIRRKAVISTAYRQMVTKQDKARKRAEAAERAELRASVKVTETDKQDKPRKVVTLDEATKGYKSPGTLTLPKPRTSGTKYEGLDSILAPMMAQTEDPLANWTSRTNNPETDEANKQVTTVLTWTVQPKKDKVDIRPKRLTYAQMADPAQVAAKRDAMRIYRASVNVTRNGQNGTKRMSADIPVNIDTNDATADIMGTWHKSTRTVTMRSKVDNRLKQYTKADIAQMEAYRVSKGKVGNPAEVLDPVNDRKGWGSVTSYGSARTGLGGRVLTNQTNSVMRDGKWTTRTSHIFRAMPGKGHILVKRAIGWHVGQSGPFGTIRTLDDLASVENGHLELVARYLPYPHTMVEKGKRLDSDNLGKRDQDGKTDISGKVLELDGTNNRVKKANSDNARKRHEKAKKAKQDKLDARAALLSDLTEKARKVTDGKKVPFAPMTRAERDILRDMG